MTLPELIRQLVLGASFLMIGSSIWLTQYDAFQWWFTRDNLFFGLGLTRAATAGLVGTIVWYGVRPATRGLPNRPEVWTFFLLLVLFVIGTLVTYISLRHRGWRPFVQRGRAAPDPRIGGER